MTTHLTLTIDGTEVSLGNASEEHKIRTGSGKRSIRSEPSVVVASMDSSIESAHSEAATPAAPQQQLRRHRLHKVGALISALSISAASGMALTQLIGIFLSVDLGIVQIILRLYLFIFCIGIILLETECRAVTGEHPLLTQWTVRGFLTTFVGVVGLEEVETAVISRIQVNGQNPAETYYLKILAWMMVVIGIAKLCMGISCIQQEYDEQRKEFRVRKAQSILAKPP